MSVSIVIPNYNGEYLLKKNLPSVLEVAKFYQERFKQLPEVIVVDDASTDNSIEEIKNKISNIKNSDQKSKIIFRFLQNEKNLGFSSTVNKGVREANGDIVVLLNTDVAPQKDFLTSLVKHFEEPKVFAVGCLDKSIEGSKVVLRGRGIGSWKRGFLIHKRGEVDRTDTLWVSGGSGAFRKTIWEKLGGFNEIYNPFYWEDIDLSFRAQKSGYKIIFEPSSIVIHEHERGAIKSKYSASKIKTIAYRNQFMFLWQNITDLKFILSHMIWLPYHFLKALISRDWAFFLGFFNALIFLPKIIKSSFRAQKLFIRKDRDIIK